MAPPDVIDLLPGVSGLRAVASTARLAFRPFEARDPGHVAGLARAVGWGGHVRVAEQVHGARILDAGDAGPGDAFLLRRGEAAAIRHADCLPVVVAAPAAGLALLAHCGWRGLAEGLAGASVARLLSLGAVRSDLVAAVGPGIGPCHFEVGREVLARFPAEVGSRTRQGAASIDLAAAARLSLAQAGVSPHRIRVQGGCTFCDARFHSARRDGAASGRMATLCFLAA